MLGIGAISVRSGLAGDKETSVFVALVESLMQEAGGNFKAFARVKRVGDVLELEREQTGEHVKKLSGIRVEMAAFTGPGRHALFDDGEFRRADEMPAVADCSPDVMRGGGARDRRHDG